MSNSGGIEIRKVGEDERGVVLRGDMQGQERFLIAEIKKGKARGGHYHNIDTFHFILLGKVMYREMQLDADGKEIEGRQASDQLRSAGHVIFTPAYSAHLLVAIENSIMVEPSGQNKTTINYPPLRKLVETDKLQENL